MHKRKATRHTIFKWFLVSYILILVIPITVGSYAYTRAMNVIKTNAIHSEDVLIGQSRDTIDGYFRSIDVSVYALSANPAMRTAMNMPKLEYGSSKVYQLIQAIEGMKYNNISGILSSHTYVFLRNPDLVIDNAYANYGIQTYYENNMIYNGMTYGEWSRAVFEQRHDKTIWPSSIITKRNSVAGGYAEAVTYLQSFSSGVILVQIDTKVIRQLLREMIVAETGSSWIQDGEGRIIAQSGNPIEIALGDSLNDSDTVSVEGVDYLVFKQPSNYANWSYICMIPTVALMGDVERIKQVVLLDVLIILLVGGGISIGLSYLRMKPVKKIISVLDKAVSGEDMYSDEFSLIHEHIKHLVTDNESLSLSVVEIKNALLDQLLSGSFYDTDEIYGAFRALGIVFDGRRYVVLAIMGRPAASAVVGNAASYLQGNLLRLVAEEALQNGALVGCAYLQDADRLAVILCSANEDEQAYRDEIKGYIDEFSAILSKHSNALEAYFGIGNDRKTLPDVAFSFIEAQMALQILMQQGGVGPAYLWYDGAHAVSRRYYYPIEQEQFLTNLVQNGKTLEIRQTLDQLFNENLNGRILTYAVQMQLFNEMKATLVKIAATQTLASDLDFEHLSFRGMSVEASRQQLTDAFLAVCDRFGNSKRGRVNTIIVEIQSYIEQNYHNADISLQSLSADFNISLSYLSQLFKEQTGEHFSEYLGKLRISKACELLADKALTVEAIALRVGYSNAYSFRRAFKRYMGLLPNEYRSSL